MKPIHEREFEIPSMPVVRKELGIHATAKRYLSALKNVFQIRDDPYRLPLRLRRDGGIDELGIERKRIAKAPLIR